MTTTNDASKGPLDDEMKRHGPRWGFLTHFVKEAIKYAQVKHMPMASPYLHNQEGAMPVFDESCIRCNLEEAIKHVERDGWDGNEWKGDRLS